MIRRSPLPPCWFLAAALLLAMPAPLWAISYLSRDEALALAFPEEATTLERRILTLSAEARAHYERSLGTRPSPGLRQEVFIGTRQGKPAGYAFILTERSRYRPITFLVALDPSGTVRRVDILVYREPRGSEVRRRRFLQQYEGAQNPVRLGGEILSVSGATVSARVITFGVNKALFFVKEFFPLSHPTAAGGGAAAGRERPADKEPLR